MTVKELREFLTTIPDDYNVVLSRDPEGNRFSLADSSYSTGYVDREGELAFPLTEEDPPEDNCLILWPES